MGVFTLPFSSQSLFITTSSLPDATAGQPYNFTLQASGGVTPYSWSLVQGGAIFSGLNVNSQGQVSGTPANSGIGLITFRVTDYNGNSTDKALSFQVSSAGAPGFQITTSSLPGGVIGQQYSGTIYVNGTAIPSSWGIQSGALPPGLILSPSASSAAILGTPNATGTYSFEVQVTENGTGRVAQMVYVVTISSTTPSNGGTGGSGGGSGSGGGTAGGAYGIATKVAFTCAGEATKISVTYTIPSAPSALVDIYYVGGNSFSRVFSQNVSSTSTLSFVPEKSGPYELHVSVGTTQATSGFLVPDCGLPSANQTHEIAINLAGQRELVFSRTVIYPGGFSKTFNVYRTLNNGATDYSTDISLTYTNQGAAKQNVAIADSVPKGVISSPGSIIFQNSPTAIASTPEPIFSWNITRMPAGGNVSFAYRIDRPLTDQMIDTFDAPRVLAAGETIQVPASSSATSNLLAASIGFAGFTVPLSTLLYAFGGLVVLALVMLLVFGRKKDED